MSSPAKSLAKSPARSAGKGPSVATSKPSPVKAVPSMPSSQGTTSAASMAERMNTREMVKDWKLHIYHGMDPMSQKLLLYTAIKKIPGVEFTSIDCKAGEHLSPELKTLSPSGKLPVLRVSSGAEAKPIVMNGVHAAIVWCEHYYSHLTPMLPPMTNPAAVADVLECLSETDELVSIMHAWKEFKVSVCEQQEEPSTAPVSKQETRFVAALKKDLIFLLHGFESRVKHNAEAAPKHNFIIGSGCTVADVALVPHLMWLVRRGADLSINFPILHTYLNHAFKCQNVIETYKKLPNYTTPSSDKKHHVMKFLNDKSVSQHTSSNNNGGGAHHGVA